jgi:hypothetical protein
MKKTILTIIMMLVTFELMAVESITSPGTKISPKQSQEILQRILDKNINIFKKYKGVESKRITTTKIYDSETGELEETETVKYIEKSYFYEAPETTVLEYKKNGKIVDNSEFDKNTDPPAFQIFDEKSPERFEITVTRAVIHAGRECYVLDVIPKEATRRHFKGIVLVDVNSLETVYLKGTIADYPFGLKKMEMIFNFESLGDIFVFTKATVDLLVHVPIIKPNTRILITTLTLENKPILR